MTLLRFWLAGTALIVIGLLIWAIAPIVVFLMLLTFALGLICWAVIALAHALRAWSERK